MLQRRASLPSIRRHDTNSANGHREEHGQGCKLRSLQNIDTGKRIKIRQCKFLNNRVEQEHRFIKRMIRPMLGFKNFFSAQRTLAGIELVRMLKKGQLRNQAGMSKTPAELFYGLAN
ncbi:DDE-type integrase/transposase/recombinase [Pseudomaricurvus alkylphenolicus]|uniref:DDE-type integrase/transposase/recombinase n=1 Tax=Pseudomaricurvus alkylphenolicus TaxID=1306991 RepID=UPI0030B8731B